jgi:hypothetical protein
MLRIYVLVIVTRKLISEFRIYVLVIVTMIISEFRIISEFTVGLMKPNLLSLIILTRLQDMWYPLDVKSILIRLLAMTLT